VSQKLNKSSFLLFDYSFKIFIGLFGGITNIINNNKKLVLRHKMQMQNQQRAPLSNRRTRNEINVSSALS